MISIIIF